MLKPLSMRCGVTIRNMSRYGYEPCNFGLLIPTGSPRGVSINFLLDIPLTSKHHFVFRFGIGKTKSLLHIRIGFSRSPFNKKSSMYKYLNFTHAFSKASVWGQLWQTAHRCYIVREKL